MNERESAICARVKSFREEMRWGQIDFAKALGLTRDQLASVEYSRIPLRYHLAREIVNRFGVHPIWLAAGAGPERTSVQLPRHGELDLSGSELYSEVFDHALRQHLVPNNPGDSDSLDQWVTAKHVGRIPTGPAARRDVIVQMGRTIEKWIEEVPDEHLSSFWEAIEILGYKKLAALPKDDWSKILRRKASMELLSSGSPAAALPKSPVDSLLNTVNTNPVTPTWDQVVERAKAATTEPGSKGKLAERLGVPQSRLSEWLGGKYEPGAGVAFQLLRRVEELEVAQKKMAVGVLAPAAVSARTERHQGNETKQSAPGEQSPGRKRKSTPSR